MTARIRALPTARLLASPLAVAGFAGLAVILTLAVVRTAAARFALGSAIKRTQTEITELKAEQARLSVLVARLKSPQSLESDARLRLNLARPGETLAVLPEPTTASVAEIEAAKPIPERWFDYFFRP